MPFPCASTTADVGGLIAAIATLGLLGAAWKAGGIAKQQLTGLRDQLVIQQQIERRRRVYQHLARLNDPDFIRMSNVAGRLFKSRLDDRGWSRLRNLVRLLLRRRAAEPDGWKAIWKDTSDEDRSVVLSVMNFYEIVAGEYNDPKEELLDNALADKALIYIADAWWLQAESFVHWLRKATGSKRAFDEWERMHEKRVAAQTPGG